MSKHSDPAGGSNDNFLDNHDMLNNGMNDPSVAALNISAADKAMIAADNTALHAAKTADDAAAAVAQQSTKNKNNTFTLGTGNYRGVRMRIMNSTAYTPAMGEFLGLERTQSTAAGVVLGSGIHLVMHGAALITGGGQIKCTKGAAQAVDVYCQRDGDLNPVLLKRVMYFPYVDSRPLLVPGKPEKRTYFGIAVNHDQPYGDPSASITIIVSA